MRPARVDVHLRRLPLFACGSLEGSPQPERSWLTRCEGQPSRAPACAHQDLRRRHQTTRAKCPSGSETCAVMAHVGPNFFLF